MIRLENLEASFFRELAEAKPVILVGSIISSYAPTSIPAGGEILKQMYDYIFPEYRFDKALRSEFNRMPFEALYSASPNGVIKPEMLAKIFEGREANLLHTTLADLFNDGKVSAIITPNYDMGIDSHIKDKEKILFSESCCAVANEKALSNTLFKIHGSIVEPGSMVYNLEQEEYLPLEKAKTLKEILRGKILIVMGYSGRDFDICPIITSQCEYQYQKIIWLQYCKEGYVEELSAYAKDVIKEQGGTNLVLGGDIVDLFRKLWGFEHSINYAPEKFDPQLYFPLNEREKCEWQMLILNRLACGNLGKLHLERIKEKVTEKFYLDMLWDVYGHTMEIKKSIKTLKKLLLLLEKESPEYLSRLSALSGVYLTNGNFFNSWYYYQKAQKAALYVVSKNIPYDLQHRKLTRLISLSKLKWPGAKQQAINIVEHLAKVKAMNEQDWNQRQGVILARERLGASHIIIPYSAPKPLQSRLAYRNLGEPNHEILAFRDETDRFFKEKGSLRFLKNGTREDKEKLAEVMTLYDDYLERAQFLGKNAEVWKLCRLRIKWFDDSRRDKLTYWLIWRRFLRKTESTLLYSIYNELSLIIAYFRI